MASAPRGGSRIGPPTGSRIGPRPDPYRTPTGSRSAQTTRTTKTTYGEKALRNEQEKEEHSPQTPLNGNGASATDPFEGLSPERRAFAQELADLAGVGKARRRRPEHHAFLCDIGDIAEYGDRREYRRLTAAQFYGAAEVKRPDVMCRNVAVIFAQLAQRSHDTEDAFIARLNSRSQ